MTFIVRQIPKQSPVGITNGKYLQLYQFCFESFLRFLLGVWCLCDLFVSVVIGLKVEQLFDLKEAY